MKKTFEAELVQGHKGVVALLVPFDPERAWKQKPVRLAGRRHGWLVKGTLEGVSFEGYIGDRWGRFFVTIDDSLRKSAGLSVGAIAAVTLESTDSAAIWEAAIEQSKQTTQPGKARADAIELAATPKNAPRKTAKKRHCARRAVRPASKR